MKGGENANFFLNYFVVKIIIEDPLGSPGVFLEL